MGDKRCWIKVPYSRSLSPNLCNTVSMKSEMIQTVKSPEIYCTSSELIHHRHPIPHVYM